MQNWKTNFFLHSRILAGSAFLFVSGLLLFFLMPTPAFATVLYDNSMVGTSFDVAPNFTASTNWYVWATSSTYSFDTPISLSSSPTKIRIKRISGVACSSFSNFQLFTTGGNSWGSISGGTANGSFCDYSISGATGTSFAGLAFCVNNSCNNVDGTIVLDGSSSNSGFIFNGNGTSPISGAPAFQLCDNGGCSSGFSSQSFTFTKPTSSETLSDFSDWGVNTTDLVLGSATGWRVVVHYSENSSILSTCADFPSGHGYVDCYNSTPRIYSDSTNLLSIGMSSGTNHFIFSKSTPLVVGKTYYAQIIIQDEGYVPIFTGTPISFSIGTPTVSDVSSIIPVECATFDVGCYLKQAFGWAFTVSPDTLNQFHSLTLANSIPFSYIYDMGNLYNELFGECFGSGCPTYTVSVNTGALGTITFISPTLINAVPYASTIKTILGYVLYLMTAFTLYRIITKVYSTQH